MPSSSDAVATTTLRSPSLRRRSAPVAPLARQAAVVRGHRLLAQPLAEVQRHPLDQPPRVDEHQRRAVLARQRRRSGRRARPTARCVHTAPSSSLGHLDAEVEVAPLADVDHRGRRPPRAARAGAPRPRAAAPSPTGRSAASRGGARASRRDCTSASSRSSDSARCAPRLSAATAWISSTITVRTSSQRRAAPTRR